jgi:hypothetical protein
MEILKNPAGEKIGLNFDEIITRIAPRIMAFEPV